MSAGNNCKVGLFGHVEVNMERNTAIIIFKMHARNQEVDLEIPLNITANDLVLALNSAFKLEIDVSDVKNCYFKAENPLVLLKGNRTLDDLGIVNGSIIHYTE